MPLSPQSPRWCHRFLSSIPPRPSTGVRKHCQALTWVQKITVCISQGSPEKRKLYKYSKELNHEIMNMRRSQSAGKLETQVSPQCSSSSKPASWGPKSWHFSWRMEAERVMTQLKAVRQQPEIIGCFIWLSLFVLCRSSIDEMRPTHLRGAICFTQSSYSIANLIQKHLHRCIQQNNTWPNAWEPGGPLNLPHKTNHHNWVFFQWKAGHIPQGYLILQELCLSWSLSWCITP